MKSWRGPDNQNLGLVQKGFLVFAIPFPLNDFWLLMLYPLGDGYYISSSTVAVIATLRFLYQQLFSRRVNFLAKTFATTAFFSFANHRRTLWWILIQISYWNGFFFCGLMQHAQLFDSFDYNFRHKGHIWRFLSLMNWCNMLSFSIFSVYGRSVDKTQHCGATEAS